LNRIAAITLVALAACRTPTPTPTPTATPAATPAAKQVPTPPPAPTTAPPPAAPGIDLASIDPKASPCQDFYAFACGGWIARNEIPADKSRWGSFGQLEERNAERLRIILEASAAKADPGDPLSRKVGDFYAACMDEAAIDRAGLADLRAAWKKVEAVKDPRSLAATVGRLHAEGVQALFGLSSGQDLKDSTQVIAWVGQGGLSLPDRDYYVKDDAKSAEIRRAYQAHLVRMLTLAGLAPVPALREAKAILALETRLAEAAWTRVEMRDPARLYNPMGLAGLEKAVPRFPWKTYLQALGAPGLTAFSATTPKSLARIDELVRKTPAATWRSYLRWKLLEDMASARALPKAFVDERFAFSSRAFTGAKELKPRWRHCVEQTDGFLGEALGQVFVKRHFAGDAKDKALRLVQDIQAAQGRNLAGLAWMDPATRDKGQEKLGKIDNKIGYPARWRDYAAVEVDRSSFARSAEAAAAFEVRRDLAKIGRPVDRNEWQMTPPTVNAYYEPTLNEMVFPAGILQPPFYTQGANDAVNYGAAGFVVGHELTHGFDDEGRKFDARGNLADWWSASVGQEFEQRAACVERQFSGYVAVDEVKVNGQLTLGENIADLGGLKLALAAYRASRQGQLPEAPVAGWAPEQQFYVAAAQVWCEKVRPEDARRRALTDPHSPGRWRVNGPLSNLPDFAAAFSCKAGDPMVRADRCEVW
jgi:predicted metalloendopeptidase